ncbi:redoxin family protein [Vallitaleaceae bacterium 9-2]
MKKSMYKTIASIILVTMVTVSCAPVQEATETVENMDAESVMIEDNAMVEKNSGVMAPEFELKDLQGNTYRLSDLEGEKIYMKYWASWCSICLAGLSEIDALSNMDTEFKVFTVVTPGANGEQSEQDFREWFEGLEYEHITVLIDTEAELGKELNVRAFPTSVFIGSDGKIIEALPGHKSNEEIIEKVATFY